MIPVRGDFLWDAGVCHEKDGKVPKVSGGGGTSVRYQGTPILGGSVPCRVGEVQTLDGTGDDANANRNQGRRFNLRQNN